MELINTFLILFLFAAVSIIWQTLHNGISPMPTLGKVKRRFLQTLPNPGKGTILELGAGWGSLAFPIARKYPNHQVVAYENSFVPYWFCRLRLLCTPLKNLTIIRGNFFNASFSDASLIVCYLYPGAMRRLGEKFQHEVSLDCLIATHTFSLPGLSPIYEERVSDIYHTSIFHYAAPTKRKKNP